MFKVSKSPYRPWPVIFDTLVCDEATGDVTTVHCEFIGHFDNFSEDDYDAALKEAEEKFPKGDGELTVKLVKDRAALLGARFMVGWGPEVEDEDGNPVPFTAEGLVAMVKGPDGLGLSQGLANALGQIRGGVAPQKNVVTSPAPGPAPASGEAPTSSTKT